MCAFVCLCVVYAHEYSNGDDKWIIVRHQTARPLTILRQVVRDQIVPRQTLHDIFRPHAAQFHSMTFLPILTQPEVCSNGLPGVQFEDACCSLSCGTCGGLGCGQRDGGRDECCVGIIRDNGLLCSESNSSPCIVDDGEDFRCHSQVLRTIYLRFTM